MSSMAEKVVQTVGVVRGLCPQKVSLLLPCRTANLSTTIPGARLPAHVAFHLFLHVRLFCLDSECKLGLVDDNTITFIPGIHGIRKSYLEQEQMLKDLANFDVSAVSCANDFDKQFILEAISKWYGSVDAFSEYVRGPLKEELAQTVMNNRVPLSYLAYSVTPVFAMTMDISSSLWKDGVPKEIFWRYFFGEVLSSFIWGMFFVKVLHVLCRWGAAPRFKSRCMDYAQTTGLAIFWVFANLIPHGGKVHLYRSSLVGAMLGFGVAATVFIAMVCFSLRRTTEVTGEIQRDP